MSLHVPPKSGWSLSLTGAGGGLEASRGAAPLGLKSGAVLSPPVPALTPLRSTLFTQLSWSVSTSTSPANSCRRAGLSEGTVPAADAPAWPPVAGWVGTEGLLGKWLKDAKPSRSDKEIRGFPVSL